MCVHVCVCKVAASLFKSSSPVYRQQAPLHLNAVLDFSVVVMMSFKCNNPLCRFKAVNYLMSVSNSCFFFKKE